MTEPDIELPHDVLLSNEFAQNALTSHDHNVRDTAPIPFDGGQPVIAPMRMGLVHNLEELHGLLQLGTFRVLPLESTGPLERELVTRAWWRRCAPALCTPPTMRPSWRRVW